MATFLITTPPVASHIIPMLFIAEVLVKRGHRVLVHTDKCEHTKVQAAGAELVPMSKKCNFLFRLENSQLNPPSWLPKFIRQFLYFRKEVLAMNVDMCTELEKIVEGEQVNCLIADYLGYGAAYVAEKCKIPFATVAITWVATMKANGLPALFPPLPVPTFLVHRAIDFIFPLATVRQQLGLPPRPKDAPAEFCSVVASQMLHLVLIHHGFIASGELRKNQTFIGPAVFEMPRPKAKDHLGKSLEPGSLLVSTTTSNNLDEGLFSLVLRSIAQMEIPILATSASATDIPSELASKVRIESFVPHEEVLPYVAAFVTHGGFGSVGRALKHGVPMLIISGLAESAATGSHAEKLGLAYHLPQEKVTPEAIQAKLKALLQDYELHARVKSVSKKLRSMDAPELTAKAIENIL